MIEQVWFAGVHSDVGAAISLLVVIPIVGPVRAEPPDGYYDDAMGKSGALLKKALHRIIDGHKPLRYTAKGNTDWYDRRDMDVWEALAYTDSACPDDGPNVARSSSYI